MTSNRTVPLCDLPAGKHGTMVDLKGGLGFVGRMAALGFTPGTEITVVRNSGRGPIIVSLMETQIALGRGQAAKVRVRLGQ